MLIVSMGEGPNEWDSSQWVYSALIWKETHFKGAKLQTVNQDCISSFSFCKENANIPSM